MATVPTHHHAENPESQVCYAFTLVLSGFDDLTDEIEGGLFEAGCSDALLGIRAGSPILSFDREADSLEEAIRTAIKDVQSCKPAIEVMRVIPAGAETIDTVNLYLNTRRQLHEKLKTVLPEKSMHKIDSILDALLNDSDLSVVANLLK